MSEHSPGPWHFVDDTERRWLQASDGSTIYHLDDYGNKLPNEANACLIAAAPELLHALQMVRDANRDEPHIPPVALATIERAIVKATAVAVAERETGDDAPKGGWR